MYTTLHVCCLIKAPNNSKPREGGAFIIPNLQMREWKTERLGNQYKVTQLVNGGARENASEPTPQSLLSCLSEWCLEAGVLERPAGGKGITGGCYNNPDKK